MSRLSCLLTAALWTALGLPVMGCAAPNAEQRPLDDDGGSSTVTVNAPEDGASLHDGLVGGAGHVFSQPAGIDCTITSAGTAVGRCSATFERDTTVLLQATAARGSALTGWLDVAAGSDFRYEQTLGFALAGAKIFAPTVSLPVEEGRQLAVAAAFVATP